MFLHDYNHNMNEHVVYICKSYVHNYIYIYTFSVYIRSVYKGYRFWQLFRLHLQGWLAGRRGAVVAPDTATPWAGECWTTRGLSEGFWCFEKQKNLGKFRLLKNVGFRRYYFSLCSLKVVWHPKKKSEFAALHRFSNFQRGCAFLDISSCQLFTQNASKCRWQDALKFLLDTSDERIIRFTTESRSEVQVWLFVGGLRWVRGW